MNDRRSCIARRPPLVRAIAMPPPSHGRTRTRRPPSELQCAPGSATIPRHVSGGSELLRIRSCLARRWVDSHPRHSARR
jgi:hypothetical protein